MKNRLLGAVSALGLAAFGLTAVSGTPAHASTLPTTTLGIYAAAEDSTGQYSTVSGQSPDVANYYLHWGQGWPSTFIAQAEAAGATPFIEIEPSDAGPSWNETPSFQDIAADGDSADNNCSLDESTYDTACSTWLSGIGTDIANLGKPVIMTFAHEFNVSGQYPWSQGDTGSCSTTTACTPSQWIAAWDEVRSIINENADGDAYWMWAPNANTGGTSEDPTPYWPGASEVDMVSVDGYPNSEWNLDTFSELFGTTFSEIEALPGESTIAQPKIFIAETNLALLGTSPYESITGFVDDLFAAGGDGVLEFEAQNQPTMTSTQWSELDAALAPSTGGSGATGEIHAVEAGKCLDVPNATQTEGTQVDIWDCNGNPNQQWTATSSGQLTVYWGGDCLEAFGQGTAPGTEVDIWPCSGGTNQQWSLNANGTITGVQSGLCLDVTEASTADGALAELWPCNGNPNQQWTGP
jgi:hypothetical protein